MDLVVLREGVHLEVSMGRCDRDQDVRLTHVVDLEKKKKQKRSARRVEKQREQIRRTITTSCARANFHQESKPLGGARP